MKGTVFQPHTTNGRYEWDCIPPTHYTVDMRGTVFLPHTI